jgi:hypothetical protein
MCPLHTLHQNLSHFSIHKLPLPTPNTKQKASPILSQRRPDGLVPRLVQVPYLYLVYVQMDGTLGSEHECWVHQKYIMQVHFKRGWRGTRSFFRLFKLTEIRIKFHYAAETDYRVRNKCHAIINSGHNGFIQFFLGICLFFCPEASAASVHDSVILLTVYKHILVQLS